MIRAKDNPFAVHQLEKLGFIANNTPWAEICDRLKQLDHTAAIVGPHGSGKTTLLRQLEKHVSENGIQTGKLFLNLDTKLRWQTIRNCIESISPKGVLFFDGACHLPILRFKQLKHLTRRRNVGLVITAHREGLLPTLVMQKPDLLLLRQIVKALLGDNEIFSEAYLADLFRLHDGNIRDCLWQLYDEYAYNNDFCVRGA